MKKYIVGAVAVLSLSLPTAALADPPCHHHRGDDEGQPPAQIVPTPPVVIPTPVVVVPAPAPVVQPVIVQTTTNVTNVVQQTTNVQVTVQQNRPAPAPKPRRHHRCRHHRVVRRHCGCRR